jgi:hypothetical protein
MAEVWWQPPVDNSKVATATAMWQQQREWLPLWQLWWRPRHWRRVMAEMRSMALLMTAETAEARAMAVAMAAVRAAALAMTAMRVMTAATADIRSRKQDNTDGTSNIVLPCPGSKVIFHSLQGDNFTLSFLLQSPYNSGNNRFHTSENETFVTRNFSCFDVMSTSPVPSNCLLLSHPIKLS